MNLDRLRQKIRKLLALAASSSDHEAASAGRHAERLMTAYGLRLEDLGEEPPHVLLVSGRSWPIWRRTLLTFAAQSNEVKALFRRFRRVSEAKLTGEMAGCQRALTFYLDLVRIVNELETMLGESLGPFMVYLRGLGSRKATDSVRRGISYGLIILHTSKASSHRQTPPDLAPSADPSDFKKPTPKKGGYRSQALVRIEEAPWEPMGDVHEIFDASSQELFELGERFARGCVVVDEAGYARVLVEKEDRDGTDEISWG